MKISKDYLLIQSRIGPTVVIVIHILVINVLIKIALWKITLVYAGVALLHFFVVAFWKRFLLSDVYISDETNEIVFKNLRDVKEVFSRQRILKLRTYCGITSVLIETNHGEKKKYFMANSTNNLDDLKDGTQNYTNNSYDQENNSEKKTKEFLLKNKKLFLIPLITIPLMMIIGNILSKRDNRTILGYEFDGRVDSIWYDANRSNQIVTEPTVFIQGRSYDLFYHKWGLKHDIQPGDSMIKKRNTYKVVLIKKNGKNLIYGSN